MREFFLLTMGVLCERNISLIQFCTHLHHFFSDDFRITGDTGVDSRLKKFSESEENTKIFIYEIIN